ncbi:MAG TPA: tRNA (adenosine(37)-N6)-threonylcarbamoyltransferase complex ATPase subunit type 1 TsaE [Thermoanaerobaculia bacterium]|nr:tRNA (adenosine(37)-N6)-threonylcarbamoyltransferase complex ATPase subunit type 1 TsaE [Thermoanaerobaculia bacterium]
MISGSEAETRHLGVTLAAELVPNGVLLLSGDLGSGKTVLARGIAEGLGIDPREVLSPTFNLIREHQGRGGRLIHVDLYRLEPDEVGALGLEELLTSPGVKVVEWAERLPFAIPGARKLRLRRLSERAREITDESKEG